MNVDTLILARWIIPVEPEGSLFENHALVIRDGTILDILPAAEARSSYQPSETVTLDDHVLIPGLINAHTHAAMSLFKGLADDLPLMDWLNNHIWPAESHWVNPEFIADGTRLAIAEMIRSGTTCFNDMYFFPDISAKTASDAGMRASVGLIVLDFPTAWAKDIQEYFNKGEEVHDSIRHTPLIKTSFAPHAPYTVSDAPLRKIVVLAEEMDIPVHMHVHETAFEVSESLEKFSKTPLQRLEGLGLLSQRLQAVHMTQLDEKDRELISRFNVNIIHCPESNLKLASGYCPVHSLLSAGINVALGTDGSASNNDLCMLGEMRTAALIAKGMSGDPTALPARKVLEMATINGARAMDIETVTGSLVKGKAADIVAINLSTIETNPVYDPVSQIVYSAGREQVTDVWIAGRQVLRDRKLTTLDAGKLLEAAEGWRDRIRPAG